MPELACTYLVDALSAGHHTLQRIERGTLLDSSGIDFVPKPVAAGEPVDA
jgi:hypothetical protein